MVVGEMLINELLCLIYNKMKFHPLRDGCQHFPRVPLLRSSSESGGCNEEDVARGVGEQEAGRRSCSDYSLIMLKYERSSLRSFPLMVPGSSLAVVKETQKTENTKINILIHEHV